MLPQEGERAHRLLLRGAVLVPGRVVLVPGRVVLVPDPVVLVPGRVVLVPDPAALVSDPLVPRRRPQSSIIIVITMIMTRWL